MACGLDVWEASLAPSASPLIIVPSYLTSAALSSTVWFLFLLFFCQVLTLHLDLLIVIQIIHRSSDKGNRLIH